MASETYANPMAEMFNEENLAKLRAHPKTAVYFQQQDFQAMLELVKLNPSMINMLLQDPRFSDCLSVLLNIDFSGTGTPPQNFYQEPSHPPRPPRQLTTEEQAQEYKLQGNEAYKKKNWQLALEYYDKAIQLNPNEVVFINNKAAVYYAMRDYKRCIDLCEEALIKARETHCDLEKLAKAMARKGLALQQLGDLDGAIASIKASLMEFKDDKLKFTLRDMEKLKKKREEEMYINPDKAEEVNREANDIFKQGNFPGAIELYTEAIKRNPKGAKFYSNRAACYIKLMEFSRALVDIDKALDLEPNFIRALVRKGNIHYMLKEYHKSTDTYQKVLSIDPENQEAKDGNAKVMAAINTNSGQPDEERIRHAMADPEIQGILRDPTMQQVLKDLQEGTNGSQGYLKDPKIMAGISKLAAAGVIRLG